MSHSASTAPTEATLLEYMPLVHRVVGQLQRRLPGSISRRDLVAAGTIGLYEALRKSPPESSPMFVTYASIRIRGAIMDELRRLDWAPRRRRSATDGKEPSATREREAPVIVHLDDMEIRAEEGTPAEHVERKREHTALHAAMAALPERERAVIQMRYFEAASGKAVAGSLGVSEARVSQLHARAIDRLRQAVGYAEENELALAA